MVGLVTSRKFWALVIGLIVLVVMQFIPGFQLDEEAAVGLVIVISSYILGVAVDPGPGGWRGVLQSRKFWGAVVGLAVVILNGFSIQLPVEITPDLLILVCVTIGSFISGAALEGTHYLTK